MEAVLYLVILGIVAVAIILILARGWRPDVDEEKEAWKRIPGTIKGIVLLVPCLLCGFTMWAMGINEKTAKLITLCLMIILAVAVCFKSYKKMKKEIKKLENELTSKWKDKEANK